MLMWSIVSMTSWRNHISKLIYRLSEGSTTNVLSSLHFHSQNSLRCTHRVLTDRLRVGWKNHVFFQDIKNIICFVGHLIDERHVIWCLSVTCPLSASLVYIYMFEIVSIFMISAISVVPHDDMSWICCVIAFQRFVNFYKKRNANKLSTKTDYLLNSMSSMMMMGRTFQRSRKCQDPVSMYNPIRFWSILSWIKYLFYFAFQFVSSASEGS